MTGVELGIGIGVGLVSIFSGGFAFGRARNGYVKSAQCDVNMSRIKTDLKNGQDALHKKVNETRELVIEVKTILEERTK